MDPILYFEKFYRIQDHVLHLINAQTTDFYLTGGTALSRGYLHHRFSDDLDLFVNDDDRLRHLGKGSHRSASSRREPKCESTAARRTVCSADGDRRRSAIADRDGERCSRSHRRDHHSQCSRPIGQRRNILDNKVTGAIDRNEPKDLADIWGLCCKMSLPLKPAIHDASSKAAGIFPADLARVLCSAKAEDWQVVQWIDPPPVFIAPNAKLMSASVNTSGSTFEAASPAALFQTHIVTGLAALQTQYAVSRDGRFLINTQVDESNTTPITLILNWKPKP